MRDTPSHFFNESLTATDASVIRAASCGSYFIHTILFNLFSISCSIPPPKEMQVVSHWIPNYSATEQSRKHDRVTGAKVMQMRLITITGDLINFHVIIYLRNNHFSLNRYLWLIGLNMCHLNSELVRMLHALWKC